VKRHSRRRPAWAFVVVIALAAAWSGRSLPAAQRPAPSANLNRVIGQLERGEAARGTVNRQAPRSSDAASALGARDLDFVVFDIESGVANLDQVKASLLALRDASASNSMGARRRPISPIVRIPRKLNDAPEEIVKTVVDLGVFGIMFGHIDTKERAERAVKALRYRQSKQPGVAEAAAAYWGLTTRDYLRRADVWPLNRRGELVAIMMIESPEAIRNVNEIAQVKGVTALFFGPGDYGQSIGKPSRLPVVAPETETAIQTMLGACRAHRIACGYPVAARGPDLLQPEVDKRLAQGFKILTTVNLENF
jgi:4-hydroxy-2-oxoheptanedioate aldolase